VTDLHALLEPIRELHERIRDAVVQACEAAALEEMASVDHESEADTIYAVDRVSEEVLVDFFEQEVAPTMPHVLIAEGLAGGQIVLPRGSDEAAAVCRIIVDPIDGTRGLMYQKRSAWILTGVAPAVAGRTPTLADITLAVQTEIPLVKQHLMDTLWAVRGHGAQVQRADRIGGGLRSLTLHPSAARTIEHGFATVSRFFPGARDALAGVDDEIAEDVIGPPARGKARCFEDQYISSGGQLYELMAGHDRFVCDLRPLAEAEIARRGQALGICAHPYDLCTELIARELGVIVTDVRGGPLQAPLDTQTDIAWAGYANAAIRAKVEPALHAALKRRKWM
jgi:fructose-1,6-bisphosphatase/inositol monophosphatase family enzyme